MTASRIGRRVLVGVAALGGALALSAVQTPARGDDKGPKDGQKVTVAEAKARAKLLHGVYAATLDALHHHYFRRERAVLPARAMEDIFADVEEDTKIKARWIAVNTPAAAIPLGANCVGCHTRFFAQPPKTPRFAALVLSIPVKGK